jgi:hypothetical protein
MDRRTTTAHDLARRSLLLMQRWDDTEAAAIIHPDAANDEAVSEPPAARGRGPAAFKATHDWLHAAFAASQTHWYRLAEGRIVGHAANRDHLAQARQLGWVPPSPAFLVRSALASRRLRRTTAG